MKRIVIIGATSGIGYEVARLCSRDGWLVGAAGRRHDRLEKLKTEIQKEGKEMAIEVIDITRQDAPEAFRRLIDQLGGMDIFLLCSGIGSQNRLLDPAIELDTVETNTVGFTRMVTAAWQFFRTQGYGQLAVISSIAGTKGLGAAPAYSATKRFQNTYMDALAQLARMEKLPITLTDIRPGFVRTDLLKGDAYPVEMQPDKVAAHLVHALKHKKRRVVIDWRYRGLVFFWRLIPEWLWERLPIHT